MLKTYILNYLVRVYKRLQVLKVVKLSVKNIASIAYTVSTYSASILPAFQHL